MPHEPGIKKALVVLSPELARPENPMRSVLMQRAVALAKATGCELELFHVSYDGALENNLFAAAIDLDRMRKRHVDNDATQLAEIAAWLGNEGVRVRHEARWDSPRTDAILRKIAETQPDLVMKAAREHGYVLGITSNTDWELARRSPAHLWFVNDKVNSIDRIVAAVGNRFGDPDDITSSTDYVLLRTVKIIGTALDAEIHPVNSCQLPSTPTFVATIDGTVAPVHRPEEQQDLCESIVRRHNGAIRALAKFFGIPRDNVHIREGHPNDVLPEVSESVEANMLAMGASSISRLERIFTPVTVEPVMAKVECDILVLREHDLANVPEAADEPDVGEPKYDLGRAITNPEDTFDSPQQVASLSGISVKLRKRILQAWEYDIRAEMAEENEGGPVRDIAVHALDEIASAREFLNLQQEQAPPHEASA